MISLIRDILFLFVLLARESESQAPRILTAPDNPTRVVEGDRVTLEWTYNLGGAAFRQVSFRTTGVSFITDKFRSEARRIRSEYVGRITSNLTDSFSSITFLAVNRTDQRLYELFVENINREDAISQVQLIVQIPPSLTAKAADQVLVEGDPATFSLSCSASGEPTPNITWTKVFKNSSDSKVLFHETPSSPFVLSNNRSNEGTYRCMANNGIGSPVSHTVSVTVNFKPENIQLNVQCNDANICRGESVNFTCSASGKPPVHSYQLFANNSLVSGDRNAGFWSQTLSTEGVFIYRCEANNTVGRTNTTRTVPVNVESGILPLDNITIAENDDRNLTCVVTGIPVSSVSWTEVRTGTQSPGNILQLTNITRNDAGEYICESSNVCGNDTKSLFLTVHYPPKITDISGPQTPNNGDTLTLNCTVDGNPAPTITWTKLSDNRVVTMPLTISRQSEGRYRCTADNGIGSVVTRDTSIVVHFPPSMIPLEKKIVQRGDSITLFCDVSGNPTPSVSWTQLSTGVKHYSKKWIISNIDVKDLGEYRCEAVNIHGNVSDTMAISYEGGKCEVKCINGKQCRFFGRYLCFCERGMKGENCTQSERLRTILIAGLVFPNEEFKPQYEDLENRVTVRFADEVNNACTEEFKGSGLVLATVTRLRKGSVITDVELTFNHTVGESEVNDLIKDVTKDGKLGEFEVSEVLVGSFIKDAEFPTVDPSEPEETNKDIIYGPVIGVLAVMLILVAVGFFIKQRRQNSYGQDEEPEEISGSHFNGGNDTSENDADAAVPRQYMELREVTDAPGRLTEISPYLETHDYAPLHPGTLSWEVERENVVIEKVIGQGAFGQVAQGKASELRGREGTLTVAIKLLKAKARSTDRKDLLSELEVMKTLKPHPHVIKLLGCVTGSDPVLVIIEYVPYGDLLGYLRKSRGLNDTYYKDPDVTPQTSLTSLQLMKFSWEVADGMSYLSSRNIIHRDLAARNVLVGEGETCKVTDFGMARNVQQENVYEKKTKGRIPVKWTAYEALLYGRYTTKSDVWSFGIVLYEIFTIGGSPYPRTEARKLADLLVQGYRMPKPSHLDDALYQIMFNCWQEDPADRPTFQDLRRELKRMENQHKRLINMETYDKKLYENVEDLLF